MTIGTAYIPDSVPVATGGVIVNQTASQLASSFGAGNIKTPTKDFSLSIGGHTVSFRAGVPVVTDARMLAAFAAHSAPVA